MCDIKVIQYILSYKVSCRKFVSSIPTWTMKCIIAWLLERLTLLPLGKDPRYDMCMKEWFSIYKSVFTATFICIATD